MITAPQADQRRLLEVQAIDTAMAKLNHRRRSLPQHAVLEELEARAADTHRAQVAGRSALADAKREQQKAEADVEQVRQRAARHQARLESGAVSAKDAQALQAELAQLAQRQSHLEDVELEAMEAVEEAENRLTQLADVAAGIEADIQRHTAERDAEQAVIDKELAELEAQRQAITEGLPEELLALYDRVRERTGGLGAVALRGQRTEGVQLNFPLTELDAIRSAPADQVVTSEEYHYIIVRMDDE